MSAHFILSASGAHRWMRCPASRRMEEGLPDVSSPEAQEGTLAHWVLEQSIIQKREPAEFIGEKLEHTGDWVVTSEMANYIEGVIGRFELLVHGGSMWAEQTVDLGGHVLDGAYGTCDLSGVTASGKKLVIKDLKYGVGVQVFAIDSEQLQLYALGVYDNISPFYDIEEIELIIDQPRIGHYDRWTLSVPQLLEFSEQSRIAAQLAMTDDAEFIPGVKQCQFCKARGGCEAHARWVEDLIGEEFLDTGELSDPKDVSGRLSNEQLSNVLDVLAVLRKFPDALNAEATRRAIKGESIPGRKLVNAFGHRKWADVPAAEKALKQRLKIDQAYSRKLISPAQAEKVLSGRQFKAVEKLIVKPSLGPTLVPLHDKRTAISFDVSEDFGDTIDG